MNVEARLRELVGPVAGRLHTARSRNDQVATDFRLWVARPATNAVGSSRLQQAPARQAEAEPKPSARFTHLAAAQPVTFGTTSWPTSRCSPPRRRPLRDARAAEREPARRRRPAGPLPDRPTPPPRGSARGPTRRELARQRLARDFALEALARRHDLRPSTSRGWPRRSCSGHAAVRLRALSDAFTTGSSIMPQKRNPDAAELVRAKVGAAASRAFTASRRDEGPAARLFEGHAGGQGARSSTPSTRSSSRSPP
jgi:argininosuccinate lyase